MLEIPYPGWSEANVPGMTLLAIPHVLHLRGTETTAVSVHIPLTSKVCSNSSCASISFTPFLWAVRECQGEGWRMVVKTFSILAKGSVCPSIP